MVPLAIELAGARQRKPARSRSAQPRCGTARCAQGDAGCRAWIWIWSPPTRWDTDRRGGPHADTAWRVRGRWQLAWVSASPNLLARAGRRNMALQRPLAHHPIGGCAGSLLPATDQNRPKAPIHGRAIGASHARLARRWVSRLARRMRCPLSALLTAMAQKLCQSGIKKMPRDSYCCCKPQEVGATSAQFNFPMAESARLMPVIASPMPAHTGALAGHIS